MNIPSINYGATAAMRLGGRTRPAFESSLRFGNEDNTEAPQEQAPAKEPITKWDVVLAFLFGGILCALPTGMGSYKWGKAQPDPMTHAWQAGPRKLDHDDVYKMEFETNIPGTRKVAQIKTQWKIADEKAVKANNEILGQVGTYYVSEIEGYGLAAKIISRQLRFAVVEARPNVDEAPDEFKAEVRRLLLSDHPLFSLKKAFQDNGLMLVDDKLGDEAFQLEIADQK